MLRDLEINQKFGTCGKLGEISHLQATMPNPSSPQKSPSEAAADWCVRLHFEEYTDEDCAEFLRWHAADPLHAAEYAAMCRVWQVSEQLPAGPVTPLPVRARRRPGLILARAAAVVAAVGAIWSAGWSAGLLPGNARYFMAQETRRQVQLPDHSHVDLNQRTALVYLGYRDQRRIVLREGEAYFDVQHDLARPFVIRADNADVRVTGTHFNVWTASERTSVTVTEGKVLVSRNGDSNQGAELTAGMQVVFGPDRMIQLGRTDPSRAAAWREGKLMLDDVSLHDALLLINRYLDVPLELANREVGDLRFGGVYDTVELDHLVRALPRILPVTLRRNPNATVISAR